MDNICRVGDLAINQKYVEKENEVLRLLNQEDIRQQLIPFTVDMIKPGALLIYPCAGTHPTLDIYGCHIIRDPKMGYKYNEANDTRGAVEAGLFQTLPDELWRTTTAAQTGKS
jgi:hypothetical protein